MNKVKQSILSVVIGLALAAGVSFAQTAWNGPQLPPPQGNADAPINVGSKNQIKSGGVSLGALISRGGAIFENTLQIKGGSPGVGKVLTSDDNGNASWQPVSRGGSNTPIPTGIYGYCQERVASIGGTRCGNEKSPAYCKGNNTSNQTYCACPPGPQGYVLVGASYAITPGSTTSFHCYKK